MSTTEKPAAVDMVHHTHLSGVFTPQRDEVDVHGLHVEGELPEDLSGEYLRNGPNPRFDPIGTYVYPIDGDAMVHRIGIRDGAVSYSNRFVRTPMVVAEEEAGLAIWAGVMDPYTPSADEVGPELAGKARDLPDINVVRHGGRLLAMAEAAQPYRLDPSDLSTLGPDSCSGAMPIGSTAHPKIDPVTGEMVLFNYLLEAPYLTWSVVAADGSVTRPPTVVDGVDVPLMIHDMALTRRYIVLFLCPLVFDIEALLRGGSVLDWRPDAGVRIALIPRDGGKVRWCSTEAFWVWHFANAFDMADGKVAVDYAEWSFPGGFTAQEHEPRGAMVRAVLDPDKGTISRTVVSDRNVEFPRIDDRQTCGDHRYAATLGVHTGREGIFDSLLFFDMHAGSETEWRAGSLAVGEPIYMPGAERDYWGMIGTDRDDMTSWFVILPVEDPSSGPLCRVRMPLRVPSGLHGAWLPD
ncbi:carotenoid oxygenase family protein [Hoyosella altamirensis]|uniref:Dioxygenase n=1 Tax=Hoyosella altamirensis TaxID=616997 RepID=A0A839RT60_9ACTN|nr:carotenoid oxygenase family protein [Hoyosella altamirensis]MBB3039408.1 carotenoid cleavage dioxygenase [Hoyosella altamirensis]